MNFFILSNERGVMGRTNNIKCSCGHSSQYVEDREKPNYGIPTSCPACKTTLKGRVATYMWHYASCEVVEKEDKKFKIKSLKLSYDPFHQKLKKTEYLINFDYLDKKYDVYINGKPSRSKNWHNYLINVLDGVGFNQFIDEISTENSKPFWSLLFNYAASLNYGGNSSHPGRCLSRIVGLEDKTIELVMFSPLGKHLPYNDSWTIKNEMRKSDSYFKNTGNSLREVLGLNKAELRTLTKLMDKADYVGSEMQRDLSGRGFTFIRAFMSYLKIMPVQHIESMFDQAIDEGGIEFICNNVNNICTLLDNYNYKVDAPRFFQYILRDCKLQQGILRPSEALNLLRDYTRMSRHMERDYERYPESLKKVHDIAAMNYQVAEDKYKEKAFVKAMEPKQELAHRSRKFSFVLPGIPKDLVREGSSLHHCVASYVNDVIKERCTIIFLRDNKDLEKPHVTVEVRNGKVVQARGQSNRVCTAEEKDVIRVWARHKELEVAI